MFLTCHYFSFCLKHNVEINVVIPTPEGNEQITAQGKESRYDYEGGLPVVYLLHGAYGDSNSWMRFSSIERYAQAKGCIAVMAGVGNSFYQDMVHGGAYRSFMTKELPAYVTRLFPASSKREDTGVAGFSMGGYGAFYLALTCPQLYGKAASMSGALDLPLLYEKAKSGEVESPFDWEASFGESLGALSGSERDILALLKKNQEEGTLPDLYQSCGTEDFLFSMNRQVQEKIKEMGIACRYREVEGHMHNWDFWDMEIKEILDWMFPA